MKLFSIPENIKNIGKNKYAYIRTYGCQSNVRDSENIKGILKKLKYTITEKIEESDFIVLNTCAIREKAEEKVFGELGYLQMFKKLNPDLIIAVCGCMIQEPHIVKKIKKSNWNVDIMFGTNNIYKLPKLIESYMFTRTSLTSSNINDDFIVEELPNLRTSKIKAFVHIMFGCSNFCTFCIVPYTRGKERSRKMINILNEINNLKKQGYKEVTLLGQNVNNYGLDIKDSDISFKRLLVEVAKTKIERIRFVTSNPWNFDHSIIDIVKKFKNIMPYFHLPIQSGNNDVLKRMNRWMDIEEYKDLLIKIKKNILHSSISTDIIVGFPNETEEEFNDTIKLYNEFEFDNAYTFIYSKRKNTPAEKWDDNISSQTKKRRLFKLNKLVRHYAKINNKKYINKTVMILIEGKIKESNYFYGYSEQQKLTYITNCTDKDTGYILPVKIDKVGEFIIYGKKI